ncbi:MAG: nitroreductase family protein [Bacteroidales bacterium]|nr:nitroreductase family protein [Bacteroidales bacterium]
MDFYELIRTRESIRDYDPFRPVDRSTLERILDSGRLAPSAANRQPWTFILVSSPVMLEKVRACYHKQWFKDAPHILVVAGDADASWIRSYDGHNSIETDLAIAMDHIILAAENEGVGTCWIAAFDPTVLHRALDLSSHEKVFAITPLGYPHRGFAKKANKIRKELKDIVKYI